MVIDNRPNQEADFRQAMAVTAVGTVREIEGRERGRYQKLYLSKHPYLKEFISSPNCGLLKMVVDTYYIVSQFQNVKKLQLKKKDNFGTFHYWGHSLKKFFSSGKMDYLKQY